MRKNKTVDAINENLEVKKIQQIEDKNQLKLLLIQKTDEKVNDKFSDKNLDRRNEIIELLSGEFINLREEREKFDLILSQALKEYEPRVPQEYYLEIFRLKGWKIPQGKIKQKPSIVGKYTNEIIYSRYSKEVLPALQILNPYVRLGKRNSKHFQWLTEIGVQKFDQYVQDAINVMKMSNDWYSFRVSHSEKFGISFQLDWEEESIRLK